MAQPACSDQEFISLYKRYQSSTAVAEHLGIAQTNVRRRRRKIEAKHGLILPVNDPRTVYNTAKIVHHKARINLTLKDAVLPIAGDIHISPTSRSTVQRAYIEAVRRLKPKHVVLVGDVFDGARISRHPRIGFLENRPTVKDELKAVGDYLKELENAAPRAMLIWCLGNHDARFESYLASSATEMEGVQGMHLKDHFPKWLPCWAVHINEGEIGHTVIKHRWHNGIHAAYNNTLKSGVNFVTGHLHKLDARKWTDFGGNRYGVDTGLMADIDEPQFINYLEDNPHDWCSGFAVLTFKGGRLLRPEFVQKWDENSVEFRGEVQAV